jgi:hypothetical protein
MRREVLLFSAFILLLLLASCGQAADTIENTPGKDLATQDVHSDEVAVEEATGQIDFTPSPDNGTKDTAVLPENFNQKCNDNDDCPNGYCIEGPFGKVCTVSCVNLCPPGWSCQPIDLGGPDTEYICVPDYFDLCEPCIKSEDCGAASDYCIPVGSEGTFCGLSCTADNDCPEGYGCNGISVGNTTIKQCLPVTGSCSCNLANTGLVKNCKLENNDGACPGQMVCLGLDGWSDCDAADPAPETCDGFDNDCDGLVDNGFPDTDKDYIADCVDPDDDNDLLLDTDDNCSLIANSEQLDTDDDGEGDACDDDDDGDGSPDELDCEPLDNTSHPDATEACDGVDNNCDNQVDEGYDDFDQDSMANCVDPDDDNDNDLDENDCDPLNPNVFTNAPEACDGLDNDCNGKVDEGFKDLDGDGNADCIDIDTDADGDPDETDCAPFNPNISSFAVEDCDGIDNNCNNQVDEGFKDTDLDGLANCIDPDDDNDGDIDETDCAPLNPSMNQFSVEVCDGIDNNCNNKVDEGYSNFDGDGEADCVDNDDDNDLDPDIIDCSPFDFWIHHLATEVCDNQDNDCNGLVDEVNSEGCVVYYKDKDDDGWGMDNKFQCLCSPQGEYSATQGDDCDDSTWSVNPLGSEVCNNQDDDCDGTTDNPDAVGCKDFFVDSDKDGYGGNQTICICWANSEYSTKTGGDCDETDPAIHPEVPEICDLIDNNCDGQIDEGVGSTCGNCDPLCNQVSIGPDGDEGFVVDDENSSGLSADPEGFLQLDQEEVNLNHIWIANSGEHTVSKLDTETGNETGRYNVCSNPSRTAVDLYSDVWVACRNDGGVAKIVAYEKNCIDKNDNGIIETSTDLNGDGKIQGNEMYPKGQDECIKFLAYPGGSCQRAAGVDAENHAWVGEWSGSTLRRLTPDTGQVVDTISISCNPYGLVIDGDGIIWVSGRGCDKLVRVDPKSKQVQHLSPPTGNLYGITVDEKGRIWLGHYSSYRASRYDPSNGQWASTTSNLSGRCPRGVAGSINNHMYYGLGCGGNHWVAKIHMETLAVSLIDLGGGNKTTVGVALDSDGFLWAVNYATSTTTKIDTSNNQIIGEYPVGANPYTYSDMTGYAAKNFTAPQGYYQHTIPGSPVGQTLWKMLDVKVNTQGESYLKIRVRAANTVASLNSASWHGPFGPYPPNVFPLDLEAIPDMTGKYLQVEVILVADEEGNSALLKGFAVQYYTQL